MKFAPIAETWVAMNANGPAAMRRSEKVEYDNNF